MSTGKRGLPKDLAGKVKCGAKRQPRPGDEPGVQYYCKQAAGWGTDHPGYGRCKRHGGATPQHKKFAMKERVMRAVKMYGLPIVTTPADALMAEVYRTSGHVAFLESVIYDLQQVELTQTVHGATAWQKPAVWVEMYQEERRHLVRVCTEAIKCGIAERAVRLQEQQGALLATAIKAILTELGVMDDPRAPEIVTRHLRQVSG